MRFKAWQIAGVVLTLAVVGLVGYGFWPQLTGAADQAEDRPTTGDADASRRANVDVMLADRGDFVLRVEATGHLAPWRATTLSSQASGILLERPVEEGDFVRRGQLLVRLDSRDEELDVREAEDNLLRAQSEFSAFISGREDVRTDSLAAERAEAEFRTVQEAHSRGEVTDERLLQARRHRDVMVLRAGARRAEVEAVMSGLAAAESALQRDQLALSRTRITAPFSGHIADIEVEVGQAIGTAAPLMKLLDDTRMRVAVDVLESDLAHIRKGGTARVRIPALGDTVLTGSVFAINPKVDAERGTGRVTVSLPNSSGLLVSGLFVYAELEAGRLEDRVVVPTEALLVRQGRDLVFVVNEGRAAWTYVTVGRRSGDFVEIIEPLVPGDSVAVRGHHALSHDASVRVENVVEVSQ